ncbi:MAG TPA: hypothetical protein VHI13_20000 [Candidatus Kapabacteria bacterium]|nr:hypothetical protein [Candidatus Kapabacteria bacterium]
MSTQGEDIVQLARTGALNLNDVQKMLGTAAGNLVTITDWEACYSQSSGQLSAFATVTANGSSNKITGIGLLAYSADGAVLYGAAYTNGFSSPMVNTSWGTTLFKPSMGNQLLSVIYGWTDQGSYSQTRTITIGNCD